MKPLIGITTFEEEKGGIRGTYNIVNDAYADSVLEAGGIPVLIPMIKDLKIVGSLIERVDGLIITGGDEFIQPKLFNRKMTKDINFLNPDRDNLEIKLIECSINKGIPIFGICRGMQLLNVYFGGDLHLNIQEEIESPLGHMAFKTKKNILCHDVKITDNSRLKEIIKKEIIGTNTYHSQAIRNLAKVFDISAVAEDGVIEAIEHKKNENIFGVQWHPEALSKRCDNHLKLFKYLIRKSGVKKND